MVSGFKLEAFFAGFTFLSVRWVLIIYLCGIFKIMAISHGDISDWGY
jgi:hypothetical protein